MPELPDGLSGPSKAQTHTDHSSPTTAEQANPESQGRVTPTAPLAMSFYPAGPIRLDNRTKAWMKKYRTEISASAASLSSTLTAVGHAGA